MIFNEEAEQSVLGAILIEPTIALETSTTSLMYSHRNQIVMRAIERCVERDIPSDVVGVVTVLEESGIESIGGMNYLLQLAESVPTTSNYKFYEKFVIEAFKMRSAYQTAQTFMRDVVESRDPEKVITFAQQITDIQQSYTFAQKHTVADALEELVRQASQSYKGMTGIPTGFSEVDRITDGLQTNNLIILGARPSMGKTAFALNVGVGAMQNDDIRVDIFSLETPKDRLIKRMIASIGNIDAQRLRRMDFDDDFESERRFMHTINTIHNFDLHIHDQASTTVEQIRAIVAEGNRQANKDGRKHLVIIDYLQLISYVGPLTGTVAQTGHISRALKLMANDFGIPIIALSQLSRALESRQDKRPMMSDLRESGNIEQDADLVVFLYRDDYYDKESEDANTIEVIFAKNRDGATGTVKLGFAKHFNKFLSLEQRAFAPPM